MKKKLLLCVCSLLMGGTALRGQAVVSDPAMLKATLSNWAQQLQKIGQQYDQLKNQTKFMREGLEKVQKVSAVIRDSRGTKDLIDTQITALKFLGAELSALRPADFTSKNRYDEYLALIKWGIGKTNESARMIKDILLDNAYSMNDYERLKALKTVEEETREMIMAVREQKIHHKKMNRTERLMNSLLK